MSAKQPEIKFSPFEALLIGEKNRALKREPMKNTIFVTRLNQKSKSTNLRALFDLEKCTTSSRGSDDNFKSPQKAHEFFNKKHSYENDKITGNNGDTLPYEYKGQNMFVKNIDSVKPKYKKTKTKSNKVKFKEKCNKVQDGLKNHSKIKKYNVTKRNKVGLKKDQGNMCSPNRYGLRSKDSKFMGETEYEGLQSKEVSSEIKQDFLSKYVCKFLTDNNKDILINTSEWDEQFDLSAPNTIITELLKHNYYYHGGFEFPKCPETGISDFDNDKHLVDIIYEYFPKSIKFESNDSSPDFIDALINADIIKPVKDMETNTTEEVLEEDQKVSCGTQTSSMDVPIDLSGCCHLQALRNGYRAAADSFVSKQNHLIADENFGGLFLNNPNIHDRNDLIMLSLMRPLLQNSWVRSLQNF